MWLRWSAKEVDERAGRGQATLSTVVGVDKADTKVKISPGAIKV